MKTEALLLCLLMVDAVMMVTDEEVNDDEAVIYDPESVNLVVNIALSLFDSLQQHYISLKQHQQQVEKLNNENKIKFRPQSVERNDNVSLDQTEPGSDQEHNKTSADTKNNLENHRFQLNSDEIYEDYTSGVTDHINNMTSANYWPMWSYNGEETLGNHQEYISSTEIFFPNIYTQSDSLFDKAENTRDSYSSRRIDDEEENQKEIEETFTENKKYKSELQMNATDSEVLSEIVKDKPKKKFRRRYKRPLDREDWNILIRSHKNAVRTQSETKLKTRKRRRRRRL